MSLLGRLHTRQAGNAKACHRNSGCRRSDGCATIPEAELEGIDMIGLLAMATASVAQPMTFKEVRDQTKVCRLVFNVDGSGPAGDGVYLDSDMRGLTLSSTRPKDGMACMANWARQRGLHVRWKAF